MNWYLVSERREERLRQGKEGQLSESDQLYSQPRQSKSVDLWHRLQRGRNEGHRTRTRRAGRWKQIDATPAVVIGDVPASALRGEVERAVRCELSLREAAQATEWASAQGNNSKARETMAGRCHNRSISRAASRRQRTSSERRLSGRNYMETRLAQSTAPAGTQT
jgi:hypothetical protein